MEHNPCCILAAADRTGGERAGGRLIVTPPEASRQVAQFPDQLCHYRATYSRSRLSGGGFAAPPSRECSRSSAIWRNPAATWPSEVTLARRRQRSIACIMSGMSSLTVHPPLAPTTSKRVCRVLVPVNAPVWEIAPATVARAATHLTRRLTGKGWGSCPRPSLRRGHGPKHELLRLAAGRDLVES